MNKNICHICKKQFNAKAYTHIYHCEKNNLDKQTIRYNQICFESDFIFTEKYLKEKYIKEKWSLPEFKESHQLPYTKTLFLLLYFGIKTRSLKEANREPKKRIKCEGTCKNRYGVNNVSKLDSIKNKKKETFIKHYDVDNVWKTKEFIENNQRVMLDKYGKKSLPNRFGNKTKWWDQFSKEERVLMTRRLRSGFKEYYENLSKSEKLKYIEKRLSGYISSTEKRIGACLVRLKIPHTGQKFVAGKSFDFKITETNILIEVNGDFWHGNPEIYAKDEFVFHPKNKIKASRLWEKDKTKKELAEKYGYRLIYVWEKDIKSKSDSELDYYVMDLLS